MAQLPSSFDSNKHDDMGYDPIPNGEYVAAITKSELKLTNDKQGQRLVLYFKVQEGKYKGRTLFTGLNIVNKSAQAVEIAQKELATICRACGRVKINDSDELHGIPMKVSVGTEPATAQYAAKNIITNYKRIDGAAPVSTGSSRAPKPEEGSEAKGSGKKPWDE